jgi:hypothetical protein
MVQSIAVLPLPNPLAHCDAVGKNPRLPSTMNTALDQTAKSLKLIAAIARCQIVGLSLWVLVNIHKISRA